MVQGTYQIRDLKNISADNAFKITGVKIQQGLLMA